MTKFHFHRFGSLLNLDENAVIFPVAIYSFLALVFFLMEAFVPPVQRVLCSFFWSTQERHYLSCRHMDRPVVPRTATKNPLLHTLTKCCVPKNSFDDRTSLEGKTAVITGGNKGIGEAITINFLQKGAEVIVLSRDDVSNNIKSVAADLNRKCTFIKTDLSKPDSIQESAKNVLQQVGTVDILVNNAGVALLDPMTDLSLEKWNMTMDINLKAPFILSQAFAPAMIQQRYGKIVNITSQAGIVPLENHVAYCTSKAALHMLTKMMAMEWGKYNIMSNCIAPTVILTDMGKRVWGKEEVAAPMLAKIPLGRFGEPVEVADMAVYLASPASDLMCGQVIPLDGGYTAL